MKGTYAAQTIKVGDVVLIHDDSPRARWKMAVIENLIKGNDGNIRAAEVRTDSGRMNRPIAKLYPLEITSEQLVDTDTINNENDDKQCTDDIDEHLPLMEEWPIRSSAAKARQNISCWSKEILNPALWICARFQIIDNGSILFIFHNSQNKISFKESVSVTVREILLSFLFYMHAESMRTLRDYCLRDFA